MLSLVTASLGGAVLQRWRSSKGRECCSVNIKPLNGMAPVITTYMFHHAEHLPDTLLLFMKLFEDDASDMVAISLEQQLRILALS